MIWTITLLLAIFLIALLGMAYVIKYYDDSFLSIFTIIFDGLIGFTMIIIVPFVLSKQIHIESNSILLIFVIFMFLLNIVYPLYNIDWKKLIDISKYHQLQKQYEKLKETNQKLTEENTNLSKQIFKQSTNKINFI